MKVSDTQFFFFFNRIVCLSLCFLESKLAEEHTLLHSTTVLQLMIRFFFFTYSLVGILRQPGYKDKFL